MTVFGKCIAIVHIWSKLTVWKIAIFSIHNIALSIDSFETMIVNENIIATKLYTWFTVYEIVIREMISAFIAVIGLKHL